MHSKIQCQNWTNEDKNNIVDSDL